MHGLWLNRGLWWGLLLVDRGGGGMGVPITRVWWIRSESFRVLDSPLGHEIWALDACYLVRGRRLVADAGLLARGD